MPESKVMPVRIQRKRTRGWRLPENTIVVTRPTKWGNPFKPDNELTPMDAVRCYRIWIEHGNHGLNISELRGKNLACFCKVGEPCHADVLLELAN